MRGVAVLAVLAFHSAFSEMFQQQLPFVYELTRSGYLGVSMFFVISGYCLAASARKSLATNQTTSSFVRRRLWRVYPPLWCSILFLAPLPYLKGMLASSPGGQAAPLYASFTAADWFSTATLLQAFRRPEIPINEKFGEFNVVYWTLALEVQFYLVVAIALWCRSRFAMLLTVVTIAGAACELNPAAKSYCLSAGWFLPWWPMFAWGLLLYESRTRDWTLRRLLAPRACLIVSFTALLGLVLGTLSWLAQGNRLSEHAAAFVFAVALWLYASIPFEALPPSPVMGRAVRGLSLPLFTLGLISYSVYLIHFNLHKFPRMVLERVLPANSILMDVLVIVSTCLLCVPFYLVCERPFATVKPRRGSPENA